MSKKKYYAFKVRAIITSTKRITSKEAGMIVADQLNKPDFKISGYIKGIKI